MEPGEIHSSKSGVPPKGKVKCSIDAVKEGHEKEYFGFFNGLPHQYLNDVQGCEKLVRCKSIDPKSGLDSASESKLEKWKRRVKAFVGIEKKSELA